MYSNSCILTGQSKSLQGSISVASPAQKLPSLSMYSPCGLMHFLALVVIPFPQLLVQGVQVPQLDQAGLPRVI